MLNKRMKRKESVKLKIIKIEKQTKTKKIKHSSYHGIHIRREETDEVEKIFEEIIAGNPPNLAKDINLQI